MTPVDFTSNEDLVITLDDILDDELLNAPEKPKKITSSDRLERAFLEILEFRQSEGRLPSSQTREIAERKLGARLDGFLASEARTEAVKHLDDLGLLEVPAAPASIDDLLASNDLDDLLDDSAGILDVSDLPIRRSADAPDSIARRKRAQDFENFAHLFAQKHAELREGTLLRAPFRGVQTIEEGRFFVLNGMLLFIAEVGESKTMVVGGKPERRQRLRVIFENGTESSLYRQSLSIRLHEQAGEAIVRSETSLNEILDGDTETGHIYVLQSLSTDTLIANIEHLHKIGFSTTSVEKRVQGASTSPTYLMAPVEIVADYRVYNVKASALENLLHRVFADVRLNLTQVDSQGRNYDPSEWFVVPLEVIDQAVSMIMSGEIIKYEYDKVLQRLALRPATGKPRK
ncbi:GIY-YIG nuclease family protein [Leucobacter sp. cx-42]|uniref:GIY-YIG nuclease family protein n=1 Tax=unclassified Leucobacter TaxID=2621730 RepID=UPI00165E7732|nr:MULTISPECIES: GIY-YIG nuclease family protein [unclassified Leucobacter]MBC9954431.1 GIY-YIG nuclease family protein [Leucobacter sp. cx-42]